MIKKIKKLDADSLNLVAIVGNSDKAASTYRLSERGAKGFLGSSIGSSETKSKKRFFRKEASFLSR